MLLKYLIMIQDKVILLYCLLSLVLTYFSALNARKSMYRQKSNDEQMLKRQMRNERFRKIMLEEGD